MEAATRVKYHIQKVMRGPSYLWEYERFTDETLCDCQSIFHCLVPKRASKNNVGNLTFLILGNGVFFKSGVCLKFVKIVIRNVKPFLIFLFLKENH
jgi:hypothetical protein